MQPPIFGQAPCYPVQQCPVVQPQPGIIVCQQYPQVVPQGYQMPMVQQVMPQPVQQVAPIVMHPYPVQQYALPPAQPSSAMNVGPKLLASVRGRGIDVFDPKQYQEQKEQQAYQQAAIQLRQAMKGAGTDEQAIINVIKRFNWAQRVEISKAYTACTGYDLNKHLHQDASFNFRKLIKAAFRDRYEYWAKCIMNAITGLSTDAKRLIELVLTMEDADYPLAAAAYKKQYGKDMYDEICQAIGNKDWSRLLRGWMKGQNVIQHNPQQAAQELYAATRGSGSNEDKFIQIMTTSTHETYRQIDAMYLQLYGKPLRKTIEGKFSFNSKFAFTLCHDYLLNPQQAVASLIKKAVKGLGTDDKSIVLLTTLFSDYMKGGIIVRAYTPYGDVLKDLKGDLSGWYLKTVLAMWGLDE